MYVIVRAWFTTNDDKEFGLRVWNDELTNRYLIDFYEDNASNPAAPVFRESTVQKRSTKEVRQWLEKKLQENEFAEGHVSGAYAKGIFSKKEDWLKSVLTTVRILNVRASQKNRR